MPNPPPATSLPHDANTGSPRKRAQSEAPHLSGRWRIVGGWSSLRRPYSKRYSPENSSHPSGISARRDSTLQRRTTATATHGATTRHRISLFLRRGRTRNVDSTRSQSDDESEKGSGLFRRAQSHLVKSVGERAAGEGARYLQYEAEVDDASMERLRLGGRTKTNIRIVDENGTDEHEHQLIGEICLADFADGEDDFDLLDGQSIDVAFEPDSLSMASRASLKLDSGQLRWIGDEKDFAAFFAQAGLEELLDREHKQWDEFRVSEEVLDEWRQVGEEHNQRYGKWVETQMTDIRDILPEFEKRTLRTEEDKQAS